MHPLVRQMFRRPLFRWSARVSRRLLLLLLVPALIGTMVGVGAAAVQRDRAERTAEAAEPSEVASSEESEEPFELGFSRKPSGLRETELARVKPKRSEKPQDAAPTYDVAAVQRKLTTLKYYVGPIDGEAGLAMTSAVMAFQKVQGIGADGAIGEQTLAALTDPKQPSLQGGDGSRAEVDLTKQVLYFVEGGELTRILPVSSGNGETYSQVSGGTATALTPVGSYAVQRKISGVREADLGSLYDPMYFYEGWAIHGSNSVPAYPASHGCVRVTRADALWLFPKMPVGFPVVIYGGTHTFEAGSSAPGTSNPTGDTAQDTAPAEKPAPAEPEPEPAPDPEPKPKPKPKPEPEPEPEPTKKPAPKPSPKPSPTPAPTKAPKPAPTEVP
jgi:lipoprotein-anchoring transpeptidase ErfK/SrfK